MKKTFYCSNLAYYADSIKIKGHETMISLDADEGGTHGEFAVRWIDVSGDLCPRIEAFNDSFKTLFGIPELMELFKSWDDTDFTQTELRASLLHLGFEDKTAYFLAEESGERSHLQNTKEKLQSEIDKIDTMLEGLE